MPTLSRTVGILTAAGHRRPPGHGGNQSQRSAAAGLTGIDLHRHQGTEGIAAFGALCAARSQGWPHTLTVRTPHGGLHLSSAPPAPTITSTSGGLGPGIDTRGPACRRGGYVVGPGSIVDGSPYVVEDDTAIRELPAWLADLLDIDLAVRELEDVAGGAGA
jgi:hypothetical protein